AYIDIIGKSLNEEFRRSFFTKKQIISSFGVLLSAVVARFIMHNARYPLNYEILFAAAAVFLLIATVGFWRLREIPIKSDGLMGYFKILSTLPAVLKQDKNLRYYLVFINAVGAHVALTPFYVAFARKQFYLDAQVAGNILFIQIIGMIAASFLWPKLVKRGGFKLILKIFALLSAALPPLALFLGHTVSLPVYLILFLLVGVAVSAKMITENSVIVELTNEKNRVLYSGIVGTLNITIMIFPIALGALIQWLGYTPVFIGVSLAALAAYFVLNKIVCPVDISLHGNLTQ
ncbi:MAG: MFS transporter, partial [Spirochaetales bacterium]|nr:MFS transporter [Spirochaetales bacterium]